MSSFRTKQILVSSAVYEALKVIAEIEGMDCPDALADLELGKLMEKRGQIEWAKARARQMRTQFQKEYHDRLHAVQASIQATKEGAGSDEPRPSFVGTSPEAPNPVLRDPEQDPSKAHLDTPEAD